MDVNRFGIGDAMVWKLVLPPPPPMKTRTDLGSLDLSWHSVSPPPTYVGVGVWRLIAVSPRYTVSFSLLFP